MDCRNTLFALCQGLIAAFGLLLLQAGSLLLQDKMQLPTSITIVQPDGAGDVIGEGNDFATRVLRAPWDMSSPPYPDFPTVLGNIHRSSFLVQDGRWKMNTMNSDPRINIHPTGLGEPALNVGSRFPINASQYFLLSFKMCSAQGGQGQVFWFYDQTFSKFAGSNFFSVYAGCHIYVVDLRYIGTNTLVGGATGWNGYPVGLSIDPIASGSDIHLELDWIRLTTADTERSLPIVWQNLSPIGAGIEFYVDTDNSGYDGTKIGEITNAQASGTFYWGEKLLSTGNTGLYYPLPESLEPGQYYIYAKVNGLQGGYSSGPLIIDRVPILTFSRPSVISGRDHATTVVGDPWDMNNPQDIPHTYGISGSSFSGGIYQAVTDDSGDPQILLHVTSPIETSRYKYLTYRMRVEGTQDIGVGWVSRVFWWNMGPPIDHVTTKDIVVYEGWQTYSIDLSRIGLEPSPGPGWSGEQQVLRLDPLEVPAPMNFHLDYVMLTGDEQARQGAPFPVMYQLDKSTGVTVTLCYDTNRDPKDGKTPLQVYVPAPPHSSPHQIYLPLMFKGHNPTNGLPQPQGTIILWDTTSVRAGTYYVCADVEDGVNAATWYSDTPVVITISE